MRLLLAADEYLPHLGGVQRVILETSRRLQARGHQVTILTFERDLSLPRQGEVAGVAVQRIPLSGKLSTYSCALVGSRQAFRQLWHTRPSDSLHIHQPLIGAGVFLDGNTRRPPIVHTFYGPWHKEMAAELGMKPLKAPLRTLYGLYIAMLSAGLKAWQGQLMQRCDRIMVLSECSRRQIAAIFAATNAHRVAIVPGGVDTQRFHPSPDRVAVRARLGLPLDRRILLTVRRLVPRMGLENLLKAFARLSLEESDLYLVIGGRGRLEGVLRALVEQLGIVERVRFVGFVSEEELPAYYQAADLFVLPTVALEGFGLIILEALASGLPVVGTSVGAIPEILGQFDPRFLTSDADAESLGKGMRRGLAIVREEGSALAQRCRAFAVAGYDWERIVDRYEALYAGLFERTDVV